MKPALRLLLVDDHPLVRDGLRARLEAVGHFTVVAEAGSAAEALEAIARHAPDCVLMDISMRDMHGIELTRRLQHSDPGLQVIMLTMHDEPQYVVEAFRAGARGYVLKDSPSAEIVAAIDAVSAGRRYFSARVADALVNASLPEPELTPREREVLKLIADGLGNKEIAARLALSVRTVETHRINIKRKFDLDSTAALVKFALDHCRDRT
ncbi:response regulator [Methyloversatilis thermotolerans]|uniref:response regulator n=1 Tax=Methyloversatilis thermotolerans TaxID=1346290 RepID=UPI00037DD866|nr:response regulator transcription factor [Methyloversatilis thermotolerans]